VRFEDDVRVDAAKSERADAGAARQLLPCFGAARHAEPSGRKTLVWIVAVQARRRDAVMDRECGLDQTGGTGGGHRVADHRLHGAERDASARGRAEELRECR
jgi:hypothetical protein